MSANELTLTDGLQPEGIQMGEKGAIDLYLELIKRVLTNTLFASEPDANQDNDFRYVAEFINHYINGPAVSMMPAARFDNLRNCIEDVIARDVPGALIETGVWRGGAVIFMRAVLRAHGVTDRTVWVADSFEGLPTPDAEKYPIEAKTHAGTVMRDTYKHFAAGIEEVKRNFAAFGLMDEKVQFLKGWFKDTLPAAPIGPLAVMRLDGDYYESTMDSLTNLYDRLSVGGYVIIDDYGEDAWTYCRRATDKFRLERRIEEPMIRVDSKCYYWRRAR
jgi:Macrocin-O-methyltransferase (TylF)